MNIQTVKRKLEELYGGKNIINNNGELICEIEPTNEHPKYSIAIAVIDKSTPHFHKKSTEKYKVIKGHLMVSKNGKMFHLQEGETITIEPLVKHFAKGNETWVEVKSKPGWSKNDHFPMI